MAEPEVRLPGEGPYDTGPDPQGKPVPKLRGPSWTRPGFVGLVLIVVAVVAVLLFRPASGTTGYSVGQVAPPFSGPARQGQGTVQLSDFAGKPVVVNFWASWCGPCKKEMPLFADLHRSGVAVVGVNSRDRQAPAEQFLAENPVPYRSVADDNGAIGALYGVDKGPGLPVTYAIGADGKIKAVHLGEMSKATLDELVAKAR